MEKLKKYKGITLISLIVTITILLILAGIAISSLTNSGLFDKVKEARDMWKNAQEDEETQIARYSNQIDSFIDGNRNAITLSQSEFQQLQNKGTMSLLKEFNYSDQPGANLYGDTTVDDLKNYSYFVVQVWDINNRNIVFDSLTLSYDDIKLCSSTSSFVQLGWGNTVHASLYYKNDTTLAISVMNENYKIKVYGIK